MYFALDIGGTQIRIASSETSNPSINDLIKLSITNDYQKDLEAIITTIRDMSGGRDIQGIGCGFAGPLSDDKRTILKAPNILDWVGRPFVKDLENGCGCSVVLENDLVIAARGEAYFGDGKNTDFVYLTWGTGFGGAYVSHADGKIQVKQFEAGHQIIEWENGRVCGCGQEGCAEAYIGGGNIGKYFQKSAKELNDEEWEDIYRYAANALLNVMVFYKTPLVILGGGIALHKKDQIPLIEQKIRERLRIHPMPQIRVTNLGDTVGLYGAFTLIEK